MILTLAQPPTDTRLSLNAAGQVDVSESLQWVTWFNLISAIMLNVGPQLRASAILAFPSTPANGSSDLTIPVPGALPGMQVSLGAPLPPAGSQFTPYSGIDIVTVRFANLTAVRIQPPSGTFTVAVHTGEQT